MRILQKWHGAGNDFVVAVGDGVATLWDAASARAVCDRHLGIGADGLLLADTAGGQLTMTLYNADGSIAEMSGNGIRCLVAAYLHSRGEQSGDVPVQTLAGERVVSLTLSGNRGEGSVTMGPVTLREPLAGTLGVASVGNPHVVVLDDESWDDATRERLAAEWADQCGGANVEFVTVEGPDRVRIRVIERGVGWTLACGTGSCATTAVCHAAGLTGNNITVANPGGDLRVRFDDHGAVLAGPVVFVATVEWHQE
jgi:diaminopimelate epimerase